MQDLLAAESQQLLGQSRGPLPGLVDLFQTVPERIARLQPAEQQPAVPVDHRQQVVEVVRHPSRQPSDALQFLSLAQLVFYLGLFGFRACQIGDVLADAGHTDDLSARIPDYRIIPVDQASLALPGDDLVLVMGRNFSRADGIEENLLPNSPADLGRKEEFKPVAAQYFLAFPAAESEQKIVAQSDVPLPVQHDADKRDGFQHGAKLTFALPQFLIRPLAFGDVFDEAFGVERPSILSVDFPAVERHPNCGPVLALELALVPTHDLVLFEQLEKTGTLVRVQPNLVGRVGNRR